MWAANFQFLGWPKPVEEPVDDVAVDDQSCRVALAAMTRELAALELEQVRAVSEHGRAAAEHAVAAQQADDAYTEMASQSVEMMKANADLRVESKQLTAKIETVQTELQAELAEARAKRAEAEECFVDLEAIHHDKVKELEKLKADLIEQAMASIDSSTPELQLAQAEEYAPGTGGFNPQGSAAGWQGDFDDKVGILISPPRNSGPAQHGGARGAPAKEGGGCCSVQ